MRSERQSGRKEQLVFLVFAAVITISAVLNLIHPKLADFRVYWFGINGFLHQARPLYGKTGGLGYPMIFRYPPAFTIFFYPFVAVPFRVAGALWTIFEWASLLAVTAWAYRTLRLKIAWKIGICGVFLAAPYLFLSFKDGNAQWLATCLTFIALVVAARRPKWAGLALAAAVVIKVWPILFVALLLPRSRRKSLLYFAIWSAVIWAAPMMMFGVQGYAHLLHDWTTQELANHVGAKDIWYPSQSIRGVALRLFTDPANTLPYRAQFPDIHVATLPPELVVSIATLCSVLAFACVLWGGWLALSRNQYRWDALYFVAFSAFQPFCDRASLISLCPAILIACHALSSDSGPDRRYARAGWALALAVCTVEILSSLSRENVRLFEVLGLHLPLMLGVGASLWFGRRPAATSEILEIREAQAVPALQ